MLKKITTILSNNLYFCLFYLFISLCFTSILKELPFINILSKLAIVWGGILAFYHTIKIIKRKPTMVELSIIIFLGFTLLINLIFYHSIENLKIWIINFIFLLGLFYVNLEKSPKTLKKELSIISYSISIFTFIFSFISNVLLILKKSFVINNILYGYDTVKKLYPGLYIYKNALAIASGIGILVTVYLLFENNNASIKLKTFFRFNILIQSISLLFSKGRSAYFLVIAIPFVLIFMWLKNKWIRKAMIIIPSIACIAGFAAFHERLYNFLSARNELWYSAWLLIKQNFFFGVGNDSLVENVYSMRPNVILPGIEDGGLHNIFLQILTANGFIVLILFISILYFAFSFIVKKVDFSYAKERRLDLVLLSLVVGIVFVNLFESNLIYIVSFISIIFWTYLGYFISIKLNKE